MSSFLFGIKEITIKNRANKTHENLKINHYSIIIKNSKSIDILKNGAQTCTTSLEDNKYK